MTTPVSMRLHITPLNPDLLPIVLGPSLAKSADNITYQTVDTFPENNYGFVDLPWSDAKKLISKLNGAILKGRKMKVEEARPKKRLHQTTDEEWPPQPETSRKKPDKAARERDVLQGHELPAHRKVKRGWTEPKSRKSAGKKPTGNKASKSQAPSKYTDKEELLFRTKVHPSQQDLDAAKKHKKSKKTHLSETLVHEFEKTVIQPSFLRDTAPSSGRAAEFVDGVGWIDEKGDLVEKEPASLERKKPPKPRGLMIDIPPPTQAKKALASTPLRSISPMSAFSSASPQSGPSATGMDPGDEPLTRATSAGGISPSTSPVTRAELQQGPNDQNGDGNRHPLPPHIHVETAPATPHKVHPLEALFKKPKPATSQDAAKPSLEIETSFSFFDQPPSDEDSALPPLPATPFTTQDMRSRGVRSAAPTPDTAHPSRFTNFASAMAIRTEVLSNDEGPGRSTPPDNNRSGQQSEKTYQSDFEKRFWAERGSNNRAWKASKRAALKEQRQNQNRLRRAKNR